MRQTNRDRQTDGQTDIWSVAMLSAVYREEPCGCTEFIDSLQIDTGLYATTSQVSSTHCMSHNTIEFQRVIGRYIIYCATLRYAVVMGRLPVLFGIESILAFTRALTQHATNVIISYDPVTA